MIGPPLPRAGSTFAWVIVCVMSRWGVRWQYLQMQFAVFIVGSDMSQCA